MGNSNAITNQRFNLLQSLRGIAALLVVLFHSHTSYLAKLNQELWGGIWIFGEAGVDFFFVLSGFIICYVHRNDIGKKVKLVSFCLKRFSRIYPIYWAVLGLKLLASLSSVHHSDILNRSPVEFIKAFLLVPQQSDVLNNAFLSISWTLSFEIWFYIIFGLAIALPTRWFLAIAIAWLAIVVANFIGIFNFNYETQFALHFLFNEHNLEFCFGCIAAFVFCRFRRSQAIGGYLFAIGILLFFIAAATFYFGLSDLSRIVLFGIPSALMVLGAVYVESNRPVRIPAPLIASGNASYSIYLVHIFWITRITAAFPKVMPGLADSSPILNLYGVAVVGSALAFGFLVYVVLERPLVTVFKSKMPLVKDSSL